MSTSTLVPLVFASNQTGSNRGLGYHPDLPDPRDHLLRHTNGSLDPKVGSFVERLGLLHTSMKLAASSALQAGSPMPSQVDLRTTGFLSPVEDQGQTSACTAYATIGAVEYLMRLGRKGSQDVSAAFLYRNTRRLLGWTGDVGAYVRTTIKSLRLFGVPPDEFWPMVPESIDNDPDAFTYSFASNFRNIAYARLDGYGNANDPETMLQTLRQLLAHQLPVVFGFPVFAPAFTNPLPISGSNDHWIPFPQPNTDKLLGGHAVVAVGYDDSLKTNSGTGAVLIRNSWGPGWGDDGYAYLPYEYFLEQLAVDLWFIHNKDWINLEEF